MSSDNSSDIFLKKIWRNIYIKKKILKCIHSFNSFKFNIEIDGSNTNGLEEYKACEYNESHSTVRIYFTDTNFHSGINVKESTIELIESLSSFLTNSVHTLELCSGLGRNIELPENSIPNTIKNLTLDGFSISKIPDNIEKLIMGTPKQHETYNNLFSNKQCLVHLDFSAITYVYDYQFELKFLPTTIEVLKLPNKFNTMLEIGSLPPGLVELYFGTSYDMEIKENILPLTLKVLEFGQRFNKPFGINVLSSTNIEILKFNRIYQFSQFNQEFVPSSLPMTLKHLEFGDNFEHQIKEGTLTSTSLEVLIFGSNYNHSIDGCLPDTLKRIVFGILFDQKITKNSFPSGLTSLKFVCAVHKGFEDNWIPKSLIKLSLGNPMETEQVEQHNSMVIPNHIKKFTFYKTGQIIPPSIEYLSCRVFPSIKNISSKLQSIRELKYNNVYNDPLPNLKQYIPNIEILHIVKYSKTVIFPTIGLKSLKLGNGFFIDLKKEDLPQSLEILELSLSNSQVISNSWLPDNIKVLIINGKNEIKLPLPSSLHSIYLYCDYNYKKNYGVYYNPNSQRIPTLLKTNPNLIGLIKPTTNKKLFKQLSRTNKK